MIVDSNTNVAGETNGDAANAKAHTDGGEEAQGDGAEQPDGDTNMTDAQPEKPEGERVDSEGPSIVVKT